MPNVRLGPAPMPTSEAYDLEWKVEYLLTHLENKIDCVRLALEDLVNVQPGDAPMIDFHDVIHGAANILGDSMKVALQEFDEAVGRSQPDSSTEAEEVGS